MSTPPSAAEDPFVSVLMPVRNEGLYIRASLRCVLEQDYPQERLEILVADGRSTDDTREVVAAAARRDSRVRLVDNPGGIVATGLNGALLQARGEVLVRVDGHCEIAPDYVRRCVEHLAEQRRRGVLLTGVGGPIETVGEGWLARVIAAAMGSRFGVGGSAFRVLAGEEAGEVRGVDTVAFPAYPRSTVARAGLLDEELVRNQDDEYNYRLRKAGAELLLAPDVGSRYFSRATLASLWRQYRQYGFWKVRVLQKHPRQMRWRQFVPPALALSLALGAAAGLGGALWGLGTLAWLPLALAGGLYLLALTVATFATRGIPASLRWGLPAAFPAMHLGYGFGFLHGLMRFAGRWGDRRGRVPPLPPGWESPDEEGEAS